MSNGLRSWGGGWVGGLGFPLIIGLLCCSQRAVGLDLTVGADITYSTSCSPTTTAFHGEGHVTPHSPAYIPLGDLKVVCNPSASLKYGAHVVWADHTIESPGWGQFTFDNGDTARFCYGGKSCYTWSKYHSESTNITKPVQIGVEYVLSSPGSVQRVGTIVFMWY